MIELIISREVAMKVQNKYLSLYSQLRRKYGKAYPRTQLYANIRSALSCNGSFIESTDLQGAIYRPWATRGYRVFPYNHWFYAVKLVKNQRWETIAQVVDALYEADYHNDAMQTKPYESKASPKTIILTESDLVEMTKMVIRKLKKIQTVSRRLYS